MEDTEMADGSKVGLDGEDEKAAVHETEQEEPEESQAASAESDEAEAKRKKSAMNTLSFLEKEFAAFRDRLHDERLTNLTQELAILDGPNAMHPEFLAMLQCIDARRDEKLQHERIALQYSLKSLERRSVAERSQIHSEYFQTARDVRERHLYRIGEQWYQIQQDRRRSEEGVADYAFRFPTHRPKQISQQTAYNNEVSILSGFAKYVGFPAAPLIEGAKASDIQEDLLKMGIKPQLRKPSTQQSTSARLPLASASVYKKPAAEEQFIEQTPWANPHHPIHQQRLHQPQVHLDKRGKSPMAETAGAKRKLGAGAAIREPETFSAKLPESILSSGFHDHGSLSVDMAHNKPPSGSSDIMKSPLSSRKELLDPQQYPVGEFDAGALQLQRAHHAGTAPAPSTSQPTATLIGQSKMGDGLDPGGNASGSAMLSIQGAPTLVATVGGRTR